MDPKTDNPLFIQSLNVNGISVNEKRDKVFKLLREHNADVLFLQETHVRAVKEWKGLSFCSFGSNKSAGSAVLFRKGLDLEVQEQSSDYEGGVV